MHEGAPMKRKALLIALALIVLTLIILSSVIQPSSRETFEKLMGFRLPETAEFILYAYNRVTQEGLFDIRLSPAEYGRVTADLEAAIDYWDLTTEGDAPNNDLEFVSGGPACFPPNSSTNFPRRFWFLGKNTPMMKVKVLREKQSGYYRLQVNWFR